MRLHQRRGGWGGSGESLAGVPLGMESPVLCQLLPAGPGQAGCRGWHGCFFLLLSVRQRANEPAVNV